MSQALKVRPFLGRMLVKIIKEDTKKHLDKKVLAEHEGKVSKEFLDKFEVIRGEDRIDPVTGQKRFEILKNRLPINRGTIVTMSPDCFGEAFKTKFGNDREYPGIGDTVIFTPNKSYQVDSENEYHIVDDCELAGWIKAEDMKDE